MTPLEIHLLLNLYHCPDPQSRYPEQECTAPAMADAFKKFSDAGLLRDDVEYRAMMVKGVQFDDPLTAKGMLLVERLMEVKP